MGFRTKNAVISLLIANIAVFALQFTLGSWFTESFMFMSSDVLSRPWILLTSMFLHANPTHLLFNMYALFIFGPLIEQRIGSRRFLLAYFASGIIAAIASIPFYSAALGASGAIMGIIGMTIMLMPDLPLLLFFFIPMSMRTAGIIFALVDIFGIIVPTGIANIAHLAGLGTGLAYGYYLVHKKASFHRKFTDKPASKRKNSIEMSSREIDDYIKYGKL